MASGSVEAIFTAASTSTEPVARPSVPARAGRGLDGDRYELPEPAEREGEDLTLVEAEALEGLAADTGIRLEPRLTRRNVVTRGVRLNELVGRRFAIGEVECVGRLLCEPCLELQERTRPGVLRGLVHRGGIRADIVASGELVTGAAIRDLGPADVG